MSGKLTITNSGIITVTSNDDGGIAIFILDDQNAGSKETATHNLSGAAPTLTATMTFRKTT